MDAQLVAQIFQICIIPLLGILTTFLVTWIKSKKDALKQQTDSELAKKYLDMLDNTITDCVIAMN
jgi:ABC-type sulfate transport system substrate-binding protein